MAEMKIDITKTVKDTAEGVQGEYQYKGHTIREWADKITSGEYRKCFLCGQSETEYNRLEVHHLFQGRGRRQICDRYGLTVLLCHNCHNEPPLGAHYNKEVADYLHKYGQRKAMTEQGWTTAEFIRKFGKNYLDQEEKQ